MPGKVKTTSLKTEVENVPPFSYNDGRDSLVLAARAAGAALGREESFATLKGLSALAFRLIFPADWRRYTPDALCGFDHTRLLFDPLGLRVSTASVGSPSYQDVSWRIIVDSIQQGYPVLALHLMDWEDWGVVAGYTKDGKKLLCRTPHDGGYLASPGAEGGGAVVTAMESGAVEPLPARPRPYTRNKHWPNFLMVVTGEQPTPDRRESIIASLRVAVELFETPRYGPYYSGSAAYLYWIEGLNDSAWYAAQGEPAEEGYTAWIHRITRPEKENIRADRAYQHPYLERAHVNAWRLESLIDARSAAANYLQSISYQFTNPARDRLLAASGHFNWLTGILASMRPFAPWDDELDVNPWLPIVRARMAELLSSARFIEQQGIVEIREALSLM